jgi:alpha-D-xyloside xylohydrolase
VPDDAVAHNGDGGHRLHNAYALLYNRCVFEATAKYQARADGPPFIWARSGWAGSQRCSIGFGGDPQSDWEGLAASLRGMLSDGMSGSPFHGAIVGGAYGAAPTAAELYVRWLQAAVFGAQLSLHARGHAEPWTYGAATEAVARKWLAFRYRLIPYLSRQVATSLASGLPLARAMPLAFPQNSLLRGFENQFMCGDALLVAPVVQPGGVVNIALPPGGWYDLNSRQRYAGRQVLRYTAALDQFPVFGREGHVLPLGRAASHTGEIDRDAPLEMLWVFGPPAQPLEGFSQASVVNADGAGRLHVQANADVTVQVFGDAASVTVETANPPGSVPSCAQCWRRNRHGGPMTATLSCWAIATCSWHGRHGSVARSTIRCTIRDVATRASVSASGIFR